MTQHEAQGTYEPCPACRAPIRDPLPPDWCVDLVKWGPRQGPVTTTFTPHKPRCIMQPMRFAPGEGTSMRLPGYAVLGFGIDYDRWAD